MAELDEIRDLFSDDDLRNKVTAAAVIAANGLLSSTDVTERQLGKSVLDSPKEWGRTLLMSVLAENEALTVAQISNAGKTAIVNQVTAALPKFAGLI